MRLARVLETGTIRSRLLGALLLLAVIPVLVFHVSLVLLGRGFGDPHRIEVAGSLRMSGFLIAAQVGAHAAQPDPARVARVQAEFARMDLVLTALESGSKALQVRPVADGTSRRQVGAARQALAAYRVVVERALAEIAAGAPPARRAAIGSEVLASAQALLGSTQDLVQTLQSRSAASLHRLWTIQVVAAIIAVIVFALTLWAVNRYILQPVPQLLGALAEIGAGHYGTQVPVRGENELSALATGFNAMSTELERTQHRLLIQHAEILEKNAELVRASRLKSQFVATMSHELRTPLHAIIGYTKLLRSEVFGAVPGPMREPLQGIDETSAGLLRLINDILDMAKIDADKMELHLESVAVQDVVREVGEMLGPLALAKGLRLEMQAATGVPAIVSDRDKLRRILLNLAGNAIKFTRQGEVEVALHARPAGPALAAGVDVVVRDTGIGIAAEHCEAIFEDFHQIDGSATREHGGTGLGLAISRRLARHLGGEIEVDSRLGHGSTFTLRLPLRAR